ncbi:MAG: radical SAM protein [Zestosphaera sp.]
MSAIAKQMISRRFSRIKFRFGEIEWREPSIGEFGLYIHVPFCRMYCLYCPFYKVYFDERLKEKYLEGVKQEVELRGVNGKAVWTYVGGGTPNLLRPEELRSLLSHLSQFVELGEVGMEGNPFEFTPEYLEKIAEAGISKVSVGVESFQTNTLRAVKRAYADKKVIERVVKAAQKFGLSVNIDLMVGLPEQSREGCVKDVRTIADIGPDQVTIYPYIVIHGVKVNPAMRPKFMFEIIEESWEILKDYGYDRDSIWVFTKGPHIYDTSKEELVRDYFGLGPGAFSTINNIQTVNPPIELWLRSVNNSKRLAFYTRLDSESRAWRTFAHELYKLRLNPEVISKLPRKIRAVFSLLRITGHVKGFEVTKKGIYLVHELTKTVVESLPFPLNKLESVENYSEYQDALAKLINPTFFYIS